MRKIFDENNSSDFLCINPKFLILGTILLFHVEFVVVLNQFRFDFISEEEKRQHVARSCIDN